MCHILPRATVLKNYIISDSLYHLASKDGKDWPGIRHLDTFKVMLSDILNSSVTKVVIEEGFKSNITN